MAIKIALAGNPNCGKTTLFNSLTGSNQYVGNWPGVTVEKKEGKLKGHDDVVIQDLPGIYSLSPYTLEEVVARGYLVNEKPDAILNIIDGTNIERNLYLTTQLIELGIPVVMAVNMIDLVRKNGDKIDLKKLSNELGCEAVEISALKNEGSEKAAELAVAAAKKGKAGELPQEQVERLDALGMDWTNRNDRKWMSLYDVAAAYYHEHGNLNVPSEYVTPDGVLLGKWVARQRYAYLNPDRSSARVTPERKALLDKLGMVWEKYDPWQERYDLALAYKTEHGDLEIPSIYKTADGVWLGSWVSRQRQALNSGSSALSSERRKLLRTLFKGERRPSDPAADHGTVREANWERNFRSAARYARKYKHLLVPASYVDSDGVRLGVWISNLRAARKNRPDSYQVTPAHIKKLNSIGMVWDARDAKWGTAYQQAKAYYKAHGNLHAAANYKSDETGFCLGDWLRRMREWDTTHDPKLTPERRAMLDKIGMEWSE